MDYEIMDVRKKDTSEEDKAKKQQTKPKLNLKTGNILQKRDITLCKKHFNYFGKRQ